MAGKYTSQKDLAELALYRQLAEINGRLDALKAMEAIENDIRRNKRFDNPLTLTQSLVTAD